jgi:hypothetical protein
MTGLSNKPYLQGQLLRAPANTGEVMIDDIVPQEEFSLGSKLVQGDQLIPADTLPRLDEETVGPMGRTQTVDGALFVGFDIEQTAASKEILWCPGQGVRPRRRTMPERSRSGRGLGVAIGSGVQKDRSPGLA